MLNIIVAVSSNHVIGKNNQLPWHLPADLQFFKKITSGHTLIMGRKTFDSIGRPLPNRRNIVITRNKNFQHQGIETAMSIEAALSKTNTEEEVFIIGGDTIYQQSISLVDRIYLTRVDILIEEGDAFFHPPDAQHWALTSSTEGVQDEKNPLPHRFEVYERIIS